MCSISGYDFSHIELCSRIHILTVHYTQIVLMDKNYAQVMSLFKK